MKNVSYAQKRYPYPTMELGNDLISEENGKISALSHAGGNVTSIAKPIKRRRTAVRNYLDSVGTTKRKPKNSGRKAKVTPRLERLIPKQAAKKIKSTREQQKRLQINVRRETIRFLLRKEDNLFYSKAVRALVLSANHKINREE